MLPVATSLTLLIPLNRASWLRLFALCFDLTQANKTFVSGGDLKCWAVVVFVPEHMFRLSDAEHFVKRFGQVSDSEIHQAR